MPFTPIRSLLPNAARRAGITRDLAITDVLRAAQGELVKIFGPDYSKFAEPIAVHPDGRLIISCRSPAVAQTIRLHEQKVIPAVRLRAKGLKIERLFLIPRDGAVINPGP